jgi:flagellar hook-basal body complex protein FliE
MNITPINTYITPIGTHGGLTGGQQESPKVGQPTFLDVFSQIFGDAVSTNEIKSEDMIRLMLGDTDNLEEMMLNLRKAELANDLFVNVRNTVLDAYNDIIKMQI